MAIHGEKLPDPEPKFVLQVPQDNQQDALLVVMDWTCPSWFEPTTRRLSLNDPCWLDIRVPPNNTGDFEPWTRATLDALRKYQAG